MKLAIVHDYLNQLGGAERVVGTFHQLFPEAPIYTSILDKKKLWPSLTDANIITTFMQHMPGIERHFKKYLLLYPLAFESLDLSDYDLVISSSSAFAKGAITRPGAVHVCYCHTPMRFVWDYERYIEREQFGSMIRLFLPTVINSLRSWDLRTRHRPTHYVANSTVVAGRIKAFYGIDAEVIFPPVETHRFSLSEEDDEYFLIVSRLNPYKRIDLVIEAFNELGYPLVIIGDGPDKPILQKKARSNIRFLGRQPDHVVASYYSKCRALLFPGEEDFGITPLEANAAGRPVIAYHAGGALDTIIEGETGVYFHLQTVSSLVESIRRFESYAWDKQQIRDHAERFSEAVFKRNFSDYLGRVLPSSANCLGTVLSRG